MGEFLLGIDTGTSSCKVVLFYRLTGRITQDLSQGYGLGCFNMKKGNWDMDMARELGIPKEFLPEIFPCHEIVGKVTKEAAALTGLKEGTPVAAGGLDAACGTLGTGVISNGETQEQGGQAGGMSICLDHFAADPSLILGFHVVPGRWLLQGGTTGGAGIMRWLVENFGDEENDLLEFNLLAERLRRARRDCLSLKTDPPRSFQQITG